MRRAPTAYQKQAPVTIPRAILYNPHPLLHFMPHWLNMSHMLLIVNGQPCTLPDGASLEDAVKRFSATPAHVIAELNGTIIAAPLRPAQILNANDTIELVAFMGGGSTHA